VALLERKGWIHREIDLRDRRHILVILTDAGLELVGQLLRVRTEIENRLVGGLSEAARRQLNVGLRELLLHIEGPADGYR
jgi:DNA-binding MarR family transcriptional regulator